MALGVKHKVNINDADLLVLKSMVAMVCKSMNGIAAALTAIAKAIANKKMELK